MTDLPEKKTRINRSDGFEKRIAELEAENKRLWSEQHEGQRVYRRLLEETVKLRKAAQIVVAENSAVMAARRRAATEALAALLQEKKL